MFFFEIWWWCFTWCHDSQFPTVRKSKSKSSTISQVLNTAEWLFFVETIGYFWASNSGWLKIFVQKRRGFEPPICDPKQMAASRLKRYNGLRPWLRPWAIFTCHFVEDARNAARVLISIYGMLVHMFISSHFFHGFVSSQRRLAWNSYVLEPSAEKRRRFFTMFWHCLLCGPICPMLQESSAARSFSMHAMTRQTQLRSIQHVCNHKTNTVA